MKLRKSAIKELSELSKINISKKSDVEEKNNIVTIDGVAMIIKKDHKLIPTINAIKKYDVWPNVYVDEGAVKHVIKGADIMRPGITKMDAFQEGSIVVIKFESTNAPLASGISLFSSSKITEMDSGKVISVLHFLKDGVS